jgi:hypothetical protein
MNPIQSNSSLVGRRQFLRGLGLGVALPALDSLSPSRLLAETVSASGPLATTSSGAPLRTAFVFFPNGAIPSAWTPSGSDTDFKFNSTLEPLESVRSHLQVVAGLDQKNANAGRDGGGDHARGNGVFLTGVRLNKSATDIRCGKSIDQEIAEKVGHLTRFPSLELTCDHVRKSAGCDSGYSCAYQYNISWKSETTPMTPEHNPRLVFERLFGAGGHGERVESFQRRLQSRRSILDFVIEDANRFQKRLGSGDKEKLDQYLTGVREIERRIEMAESFGANADPEMPTPDGVPQSQEAYVSMMYDLLILAFQTDSTRVSTLLLGHDGDNRSFSEIDIPEGHHDLTHHQKKQERIDKVKQIDRWYVTQFARFLEKMKVTPDTDGKSLLDNSMILYGSGNADGNSHTHENLPILLAGSGGGLLKPGRFVNHQSQPLNNLFLSMADRNGVDDLDRFGDSTGRLSNV